MSLLSSTSVEQAIETATDGKKTSENWAEILEIVDLIEVQPNGAKDAVKCLVKRIKNKDPHVGMMALTVLDACVANAKRKFHLEISSRFFDDEVRAILQNSQSYSRPLLERLCLLIKKWSENEFKDDPALHIIPSLYVQIKVMNPQFLTEGNVKSSVSSSQPAVTKTADAVARQKEEEDFAKAIALSLEEDQKKKRSLSASATTGSSSTLYPSMKDSASSAVSNNSVIYATVKPKEPKEPKEPRKVRAMYDFEAAEDNELTFKSGEIIHVLDDSDTNWWKGSNHRGEGLFPTNFVTSDLNWEPENDFNSKKQKEDTPSITSENVERKPVKIDEGLIDKTLNAIHDADPTGERQDPEDLLALEDQCSRMWPLIDEELQKTDRVQSNLDELSKQINDALSMYDTVMKEQAAQQYPVANLPAEHPGPHGFYAPAAPPLQMIPGQYQAAQMAYQGYQEPIQQGYQVQQQQLPPPGYQGFVPNPAKLSGAGGANFPPQQGYPQQSMPPNQGYVPQQGYQTYPNQPPQ